MQIYTDVNSVYIYEEFFHSHYVITPNNINSNSLISYNAQPIFDFFLTISTMTVVSLFESGR